MRSYIIFYRDKRHNDCRVVVPNVRNISEAVRQLKRRLRKHLQCILNIVEAGYG